MAQSLPPVTINFASVKVVGIPGLSLVAIVVAIAFEFPEARWLLVAGFAGGAIVAVVRILRQRHGRPGTQRVVSLWHADYH